MQNVWQQYVGALLLKDETFAELKTHAAGFSRVLLLFLVVGLIAGLSSCGTIFQRTLSEAEIRASMSQAVGPGLSQMPPEARQIFEENVMIGAEIGAAIANLQPPAGRLPSRILTAFGLWLSNPLTLLASWFFYALMVWVAVRFLGGTGDISSHLTLTGLYVAPYVITLFGVIPFIGWIFRLIAWGWGTVIFIKGVSVANDVDMGKAIVAWLVPVVLGLVLTICGFLSLIPLIALAAGG